MMHLNLLINLDPSLRESAQELAERLALNCVDGSSASTSARVQQAFIREQCMSRGDAFALVLGKDGLTLHAIKPEGSNLSIRADFHGASTTYRRKKGGGKRQMIAKAVGVKSGMCPHVLDATAGLGKDAFVLASLGCRVTLLERSSIVHALLEDGLAQARKFGAGEDKEDKELVEILDRMEVIGGDALDYMEAVSPEAPPDVVYLDPMFPSRTKSAQVKKEMQVFHQLLGADKGADALLKPALKVARQRVVVKRPRIAPALSDSEPSYTLEGKRNRFDVYVL